MADQKAVMFLLLTDKDYTFSEVFKDVDTDVKVKITNPTGDIVSEGIALADGSEPNKWIFNWHTPTNPARGYWSTTWTYTTGDGDSEKTFVKHFKLKDDDPEKEEYKQCHIFNEGEKDYIFIKVDMEPEYMEATLHQVADNNANLASTKLMSFNSHSIRFEEKLGRVYCLLDVPALNRGSYVIMWKYRYRVESPREQVADLLYVIPIGAWAQIKQLRIYVDKIQKQVGIIQAYSDGELWNNILRGNEIINAISPLSNYNLYSTFPFATLGIYLQRAAALQTLRSQFLLEGDLAFNYAGQTITLDYDHTSFLSEEIGRLEDDIHNADKLPKAKTDQAYREAAAAGTMAHLGMRTYQPPLYNVGNGAGNMMWPNRYYKQI